MQGVMISLIVLMFLIFFAQVIFGESWYNGLMLTPVEVVEAWERLRGGEAGASEWGTLGTLVTHAFLHGHFEHVAFNMLFLWIFGALLVELLGWRWMLLSFFVTALGGGLCHVLLNKDSPIPMLGASGAVMGFEGVYLGLATRWKLPNPHIWPIAYPIEPARLVLIALIGIGIDYYSLLADVQDSVAYAAHIGGFTAGLVVMSLIAPRPRSAMSNHGNR